MSTFRTLELAEKFYLMSENTNLRGNLRNQLLRAASSIALNLAEGNAKQSVREKKRFYKTAYASLKECQTIFKLGKVKDDLLISTADHLGACLWKLIKSNISTIQNSEYS